MFIKICFAKNFKPWLFASHATSHKADWITTTRCLLCLALFYEQLISLMKVLEVERSGLRLLENSIAITYLFAYNVHSCCVRFRCAFFIYLFHTHIDVVIGLFITTYIHNWSLLPFSQGNWPSFSSHHLSCVC